MSELPRISVVVPVYNALPHLRPSLDSVARAVERYGNAELIVLDNGSNDGSWELLQGEYADRARIERVPGIPVSALRNRGAEMADGEILSFIDSDCLVGEDYFARAVEVLATVEADATGSAYELPEPAHWVEETWHHLHRQPKDRFTRWINAGNLLVKKSAFDRIGGFDERLISLEDVELCERLWDHGSKVWEAQEVVAIHLGNPKSLRRFYKKQVWRALGLLDSSDDWLTKKPTVMTVAHVALSLGGLLWLVAPLPVGPASRLAGFVGLSALAPASAVAYRSLSNRRFYRPVRSSLLYYVYFTARARALAAVLWARARRGREVDGQKYY
jgi:GT2 family glycosyltransferase